MPGRLPSSGPLSFGSTAGSDSSLNIFQNIKRGIGTTSTNTLRDFNLWCNNYVVFPGYSGPINVNGSAPYRFSELYSLELIKFEISIANETPSKYGTNNDAGVYVTALYPNTSLFNFNLTDLGTSATVNAGQQVLFGRYSNSWDAGAPKTLTVNDVTYGISCSITVIPAYNNATAQVTGTQSAGGAGVSYYKSGSTTGGPAMTFYSGPRDPGGNPQG